MIKNAKNIVAGIKMNPWHTEYETIRVRCGIATFADGFQVYFIDAISLTERVMPVGNALRMFTWNEDTGRGRKLGERAAARRKALEGHMAGDVVVGVIGRVKERPERLALLKLDGSVSNWFAQDRDRADVVRILEGSGMTVRDDDTVVHTRPPEMPAAYAMLEMLEMAVNRETMQ